MEIQNCPLCHSHEARYFYRNFNREYHRCSNCFLVFVPAEFHVKNQANLHTDYKKTKKFRQVGEGQYFALLTNQVLKRTPEGAIGLDYKCGKESKVAELFTKNGKLVKCFDLEYKNDPTLLTDIYDFITVIHQIETYANPREEFDRLYELLSAQGVLALMTTPLMDLSSFNSWPFIKEAHHISFFSPDTFEWIAKKYHYHCEVQSDGIVLFTQK